MENAKKLLGQKVKAAREAKGYKQKDLARLVKVTGTTIARIESGRQGVRAKVMDRIVSVLGEPHAYYLSEDRPPLPKPKENIETPLEAAETAIKLAKKLGPKLVARFSTMNETEINQLRKAFAPSSSSDEISLSNSDQEKKPDDQNG